MKKQATLILWLTAFGIFVILQTMIYHRNNRVARTGRAVDDQVSGAEAYRQKKKDSCRIVVAIGSSLTGNGLYDGIDFARNSLEKFGKDIYMVSLTAPFDPGEMFLRDLKLVDRILPLKPDLFMIQMELATIQFDPQKTSSFPDYTPFLIELSSANLYFFDVFRLQERLAEKLNLPEKDIPLTGADTLKYAAATVHREIRKEASYLSEALVRLGEAGIPVLIYEVPRPYGNEIYSAPLKRQLDSVLNALKARYKTDYLFYDGPKMYYRFFADGGHLNLSGSTRYTDWLNDRLINRLYP